MRLSVTGMTEDETLDTRGLKCPLPVLKARKRLKGMASGAVLRVIADDPAAIVDFPFFCAETGDRLDGPREDGTGAQVYTITKA